MARPRCYSHFATVLVFVSISATSDVRLAAAPPAELRYVPADSAFFVYVDVAAIYDSKIGEAVRNSKSVAVKDRAEAMMRETGVSLDNIRTVTFAIPSAREPNELQRGLVVVTTRKPIDRPSVISRLKETATNAKDEFGERDGVVRVTSTRFDKRTTVFDLTDPQRMVILNHLPESYLKPADGKPTGLQADAITRAATTAFVLGVNFGVLPAEIRGENLPPQARPFQPIFRADSLTATGTLSEGRIELEVRVRSQEKANAVEVEKAFGAVQTLATLAIPQAKKQLAGEGDRASGMVRVLDELERAVNGTKFAVEDADAVARLSAPLDLPFEPILEYVLSGGGASDRMQSSNNLKQLALAVYNYESSYGFYPPAATLGKKGQKLHSWRVAILPFIEQESLYKKFRLDEPWDSEHNLKVFQENPMPKVFSLPGTPESDGKKTHYQAFVGNGAMFETVAPLKIADITDGTSNTVMFFTAAKPVEWTKPDDVEFDPKQDVKKLLLFQNKAVMMAFGDGSVRAVSETVSESTLKALITRNGGEVVGNDFE